MSKNIYHNPITGGNYADPEARIYDGEYWIYATQSKPFEQQHNLSCFHSTDMKSWREYRDIINISDFGWIWGAVWAPTVIEKNGRYYMIFASNCLRRGESIVGGIEAAVADTPKGPFFGYLGKPLIGEYINDAQPIDAHLFKDDDGTIYLYYGGSCHCNVCIMNETMDGFVPFADGTVFREITPPDYVEGPCMLKRNGKYVFMWSVGNFTNDSYGVMSAVADSPCGPFDKPVRVLRSKDGVGKGPGHNGYFFHEQTGEYDIVYHRRNIDETDGNDRHLCIDRLRFDDDAPLEVNMT